MIERIKEMLKFYDVDPNIVLNRYNEKHRYYHNLDHIINLLNKAESRGLMSNDLFLAIVFHDVIYDPKRSNNEEDSAELSWKLLRNAKVRQAILDTKNHNPSNDVSEILCELDMEELYGDLSTFMKNNNNIAKEYQFADWGIYQQKRIEFLEKNKVDDIYIDMVKLHKPNIGVYPGSFSPFHVAHLSILEKAEKIFDKVIIAQGVNPDKSGKRYELPIAIQNRQIERYDGLLTDFLSNLSYDVTVIRGLRNSTDLQYEMNQYRFLQELDPNIKVISIFCDKEHEHISSSAVRTLEKFDKHHKYLVK